ncbi:chemotaxis protein CheB [Salsipaludibacter albus]|uniref:chemotaxis protein CheB n=1 Tax=Salsipaludibacter albus TaxID=2849650 RepID=UPI001EE47D1E|nr:PAS domain-containing protein [Salsipaludibacter albus]
MVDDTVAPDAEASAGGPDGHGDDAPPEPVTIVGIGASAGGLAALRSFFERVDADSGVAWVVVVHLSPEHESRLAELLQPHAPVPFEQVSATTRLEPDHAYVIPPNANLNSIDTHLRLSELEEQRAERAPIDHFFRTLARTHDGDAIGVILTGTGSDGTLGLRDIREQGGLTIVQDPAGAEYGGMPQSAIAAATVDLVLELDEIPGRILEFVRTRPRLPVPPADAEDVLDSRAEHDLHRILAQVRTVTDRDFTRYRTSTILRRIRRRMQMRRADVLADYVSLLGDEPHEVRALAEDLLVTVTSFFRDETVFRVLEDDAVPGLFVDKGPGDTVRAWSVGCATGEEAYSLAILLLEAAGRLEAPPRVQVFATDLHEASLATARAGFYPGNIAGDTGSGRLARYFDKEDGGYRIRKAVRDVVVFSPHDLLTDPPFSRLDLVSCRNLLIYLERGIQHDVLDLFHYALNQDGVLVLGTSETIESQELFTTLDGDSRVYRRRDSPAPEPRLPVFPLLPGYVPGLPVEGREARTSPPIAPGALHQRVVERHAPPSLLVAADDRIVHLSERAGRYLLHPGGSPTSNVVNLVRPELRAELRSALHDARRDTTPVQTPARLVAFNGDSGWVRLDVRAAVEPGLEGFVLVLFMDVPGADEPTTGTTRNDGEDAELQLLRSEVEVSKRRLQSLVEQYETSQQELRASNEELQSSNEELRSTLEELETGREELQSVNEELQTVNEENRHKVEELSQLSSDLKNLFRATDIATLFLDRRLRILRYTPRVADLFSVRPADRGRPVTDLAHQLDYPDLSADAEAVLGSLVPVEREIPDVSGRWYLTRVSPYRSNDDRIEGVVVTFVDISGRRQAEQDLLDAKADTDAVAETLRQSEKRYRTLFETMDEGFCVLEVVVDDEQFVDHRFIETNPAFEEQTGFRDAVGSSRADLDPQDGQEWLERCCRVAVTRQPVRFEGRAGRFPERWFDIYAFPTAEHEDLRVAVLLRDVTDRRRAEEDLRRLTEELERRVATRTRQAQLLSESLSSAEQQERTRLSGLLHDDLQQLLYGIQMQITVARQQAASGDVDETAVEQALAYLDEAITLTRQLTVDLDPPVLRGDSLVDALQWLQTHMRDLHGLEVEVRDELEEADIGPDGAEADRMRRLVFQVVRELLFNVAKHAQVDSAVVTAERVDDEVQVTVADHGLGFDPARLDTEDEAGSGLHSARERLRLHGGELQLQAAPGEGVTAVIRLPAG